MNFKEFLEPNKSYGHITRDGKIHYYPNTFAWISFKRINLEDSNRNSYWLIDVAVLNHHVKEALRIWALNMPEHYQDDVEIRKKEQPIKYTTVEKIANMRFNEDQQRGLVSFDFDGVLHIAMHPNTIHPNIWDSGDLPPREKYIQILKQEAKSNSVIIMSARCETEEIWEFVKINRLPVQDVIATCMEDKVPLLMEMGAIRHYDDDIQGIHRQMERYKPEKLQFIPVPTVKADEIY